MTRWQKIKLQALALGLFGSMAFVAGALVDMKIAESGDTVAGFDEGFKAGRAASDNEAFAANYGLEQNHKAWVKAERQKERETVQYAAIPENKWSGK